MLLDNQIFIASGLGIRITKGNKYAQKTKKEIITEIDSLVAILYMIDEQQLRKIALSFPKYYSK